MIRSQQAASSFSSTWTLNLVWLCNVFLGTWSNFEIVATICCLDVLGATTSMVIILRATQTSSFLDFPNLENAFDRFSMTITCAFLLLASWKPNTFVVHLSFLYLINPCGWLSKYSRIMLLRCFLTMWLGLGFPRSSRVLASKLSTKASTPFQPTATPSYS